MISSLMVESTFFKLWLGGWKSSFTNSLHRHNCQHHNHLFMYTRRKLSNAINSSFHLFSLHSNFVYANYHFEFRSDFYYLLCLLLSHLHYRETRWGQQPTRKFFHLFLLWIFMFGKHMKFIKTLTRRWQKILTQFSKWKRLTSSYVT